MSESLIKLTLSLPVLQDWAPPSLCHHVYGRILNMSIITYTCRYSRFQTDFTFLKMKAESFQRSIFMVCIIMFGSANVSAMNARPLAYSFLTSAPAVKHTELHPVFSYMSTVLYPYHI
jgi:hypothetical protein